MIFNDGTVFVGTVIVAGNGACTNITACTDVSITQISEMIGFRTQTDIGILDFNKVTDMDVIGKIGAWT